VGPGSHFFQASHTLARYERAFYTPLLSDWRNFETWSEDGALDATQRAHRIWQALLAAHEEPPIDPGIAEELDAFVARRKEQSCAPS
jgi:trimethylamine---corrinoid protein Co-methyltransferase